MPGVVVTALKAHRTRQLEDRMAAGGEWEESGLVFTSPVGTPLDGRNVYREFRELLTAAELPAVRFHDLRHAAATLLLSQGVDARTIMETLGQLAEQPHTEHVRARAASAARRTRRLSSTRFCRVRVSDRVSADATVGRDRRNS
jgi:integrase